jgi:glutaminyl-peptide cyclotransferase
VGDSKRKKSSKGAGGDAEAPRPAEVEAPRAPRRDATSASPARLGAAVLVVVGVSLALMWWRSHGETQVHDHGGGDHGSTTSAHEGRDAGTKRAAASSRPEALRVNVLESHPHDPSAFTQGLQWIDGQLYEGTGIEGRSQLRRIQLATWSVEQHVDLPDDVFGEGIAVVGDRIFEITWQEGIAYVWNRQTFERVGEHHYEGEGWGLCWDGTHLVMSDGSDELFFRNPTTFEVERRVHVTRSGHEVRMLNELECVDGLVYANIWQTDRIARIDPESGRVTGWIDASGLLTEEERYDADVLNGITWLPDTHRFLITGKLWPRSFEVEFVPDDHAATH